MLLTCGGVASDYPDSGGTRATEYAAVHLVPPHLLRDARDGAVRWVRGSQREYAFSDQNTAEASTAGKAFLFALPVVWLSWCVLFGIMAFRISPELFASRLYKSLLTGSVLELLIAIPMHMVVRQRSYCCAGFGTGMGIAIGLLVMLIALGPAVIFLFYRRYYQVYARHPKPE